jgi:hypothetical protein
MIGFGKSFKVLIALVQENSNKVAIKLLLLLLHVVPKRHLIPAALGYSCLVYTNEFSKGCGHHSLRGVSLGESLNI